MEGFGKKIDKKRRQYFIENVCDGVLVTQPTKHCVDGREGKASDNSHCHAAYKKHGERSRCVYQRERTCYGCSYGELECNNAGCIVNQGLSREKRLLAMGQVDVGLKRGDGGCVGWPQGRGQRKRRS